MEKYNSPVYKVIPVPIDKVVANSYNPNVVAPPEMNLLELSIGKTVIPCLACATIFRRKTFTNWWTVTIATK